MSFSNDVKLEILENKPLRVRFRKAQAYGLLLFSKQFSYDGVSITTESLDVAELYSQFVREFTGDAVEIVFQKKSLRGKEVFSVSLPRPKDRRNLLEAFAHQEESINLLHLPDNEHIQIFLGGAFLACGNLSDPVKSYHLEFVARDLALSQDMMELLEGQAPGVKRSRRRGTHILYYKDCKQIEDLLAMMGASKASLSMIEVEIIKEVRNKANRVTNCETANIDKLVRAASDQIEDIKLIYQVKGEDFLPDNLRQVAKLRVENPELSLRQLAEEMPEPISRSGMHHRLDKLSKIAGEIREELQKGEESHA